ncbi:MAG: helicase-exonuclease AddAB subunit AddA, partial [Acetivibrionales bacterium]
MSETRWTTEQWDAITARDCNLLVAAAAGAGKTAVLVERIIRKITDENNPVDIDKLLIVTFTNAAAAEMRERIADAISSYLESNKGSEQIQRQMALLGKASITTIHSFCTEVIRSNFQNINIDPYFRIADETESTLMKLEALDEVFEEQYEIEENRDFYHLLESYCGNRDDRELMDIVLNLYTFIQSNPWPEVWLEEMTEALKIPEGTDFAGTIWGKALLSATRIELEGMRDMLARAIEIIKTGFGIEKYLPVYQEDLANIEKLIMLLDRGGKAHSQNIWDDLYSAIDSIVFSTLPKADRDADKYKQEIVKSIRDDVKKRVKKLSEETINAASDELSGDLRALYANMKCLCHLTVKFSEKYAGKKSRRSVLDFNDLEHYCLELLSVKDPAGKIKPSETAIKYRERFEEIMVDEYQDSNMVQEIIINMISKADINKPNVFMVGDVKQSIYRFRQARPELFMEKYNTYSKGKESLFRKILLYKNFRSRKNVVDAVNFIFSQIMSVNAGELDYTENEALNPGAYYPENECENTVLGGSTELHLIRTDVPNDETDEIIDEINNEEVGVQEEEMLDSIQCEARMVARRIQMLMKSDEEGRSFSVFDKGKKTYRKLEYRDIVILLRSTKNWSDVFSDELTTAGIPVFADTGSGFFKTTEVQVVLSLLQIIDNPYQDIPLLSVLRSPIFSFTTDELTDIRITERRDPLFEGLRKLAEKEDGEAAVKAKAFLKNLGKWREEALYLPTDRLIWKLYNDTGYYNMVAAMPGGAQRQANLLILFERAKQFEETSYKGLFNFINFIDKLKSSRGDMGSAKILSENDNVVRIMSIHKSKGLEFPVIFLSGCGKKFNFQDMNKSILLHQDLGFGPDAVDYTRRLSWPTAAKEAIKAKIKAETISEEMRILYVAITRAREKLIITGSASNLEKALNRWILTSSARDNKLPDYEILKGKNYLDWIVPAVLRHRSCGGFREMILEEKEFKGLLIDDSSVWDIKIWEKRDVLINTDSEEKDLFFNSFESSTEKEYNEGQNDAHTIAREIDRRLNWKYANEKAAYIPAKVSVTELKRRLGSQSAEESASASAFLAPLVKKPMFLEEGKGLSAAERGSIVHFIMQHLNLDEIKKSAGANFLDNINNQVEKMVAGDLLTLKQAKSIDIGIIERFFNTELARRMLRSDRINRETPFNIAIPAQELYGSEDQYLKDETVLLQGVIDCFFEEEDGVVIIDYKTDYAPKGKEYVIRDRYKLQLDYYTRALEKITGK